MVNMFSISMEGKFNMKVKEMIDWLKTQPQEAIVQVLTTEETGGDYYSYTYKTYKDFDPSQHVYMIDYTKNNIYVKEQNPRYGKIYLELGGEE